VGFSNVFGKSESEKKQKRPKVPYNLAKVGFELKRNQGNRANRRERIGGCGWAGSRYSSLASIRLLPDYTVPRLQPFCLVVSSLGSGAQAARIRTSSWRLGFRWFGRMFFVQGFMKVQWWARCILTIVHRGLVTGLTKEGTKQCKGYQYPII